MRRFAALAALALLLVVATGMPAQDPPSSREQELETIRGEIARLTARLETVSNPAAGIAGDLDRLEIELELQTQKVAEAASAKAIAEERAAASEAAIADLERRLAEERRKLRLRLTGLYRMGRHGYLRMLLCSPRARRSCRRSGHCAFGPARRGGGRQLRGVRGQARHGAPRARCRTPGGARLVRARERPPQPARRARVAQLHMLAGTRREGEQIANAALELGERARKLSSLLDALYGRSDPGSRACRSATSCGLLHWPVAAR